MSERIDCIQLKTGNCGGCEIPQIVEQRVRREGAGQRGQIMAEVSSSWCPPGTQMRIPETIGRSKVW